MNDQLPLFDVGDRDVHGLNPDRTTTGHLHGMPDTERKREMNAAVIQNCVDKFLSSVNEDKVG